MKGKKESAVQGNSRECRGRKSFDLDLTLML